MELASATRFEVRTHSYLRGALVALLRFRGDASLRAARVGSAVAARGRSAGELRNVLLRALQLLDLLSEAQS